MMPSSKRKKLDTANPSDQMCDVFSYVDEDRLSDVSKACLIGSVTQLQELLNEGRSTNVKDNQGRTALHIAAGRGNVDCCKLLLQSNDVEVNCLCYNGITPLMEAVKSNCSDLVSLLLIHGAKADIMDGQGNSCLDRAVENDNVEMFQQLLATMNPNISSFEGWSISHTCAKVGNFKFLKILIDDDRYRFSPTDYGITPLHLACQEGNLECVQLLVKANPGSLEFKAKDGVTPIFLAAQNGHTNVVVALLALGASVHTITDNGTVLHSAVIGGNDACLKLILEAGADVEGAIGKTDVDTPLSQAIYNQNMNSVKILIEHGANPLCSASDPYSSTPLHLIIESLQLEDDSDAYEILRMILPNIPKNQLDTALHKEIAFLLENSDNLGVLKKIIDFVDLAINVIISSSIIFTIVENSCVKCLHFLLVCNFSFPIEVISQCLLKYFIGSTAGMDHKHIIHRILFDQYMIIPREFYTLVRQSMDPITTNPMKLSLLEQLDKFSMEPRTLIDFCRFKIRNLISCRQDFSSVIDSLKINEACKEILLLERASTTSPRLLPDCLSDQLTEAELERQYLVM